MSDTMKRDSKFISLVLRHEPEKFGVVLDEAGWTPVEGLLAACARAGRVIPRQRLEEIVRTNDKQRFAFSGDGLRIRTNQGHSVPVELGHPEATPPEVLYHGTARQHVASILREGLRPGARHDVHLSERLDTASAVGRRHGELVILTVQAGDMHRGGHVFRRTPNGVWLVPAVPPEFITRADDE